MVAAGLGWLRFFGRDPRTAFWRVGRFRAQSFTSASHPLGNAVAASTSRLMGIQGMTSDQRLGDGLAPPVRFVEDCHVLRATAATFRSVQRYTDEPLTTVRVSVTWRDRRQTEMTVAVVTTRVRSGGLRYWFLCPRCRRRVGCLYTPSPDSAHRCRTCWDLKYLSQWRPGGAARSARALLGLLGGGI